jgi:hypothetical protein
MRLLLLTIAVLLLRSCDSNMAQASQVTDEQLAMAIYKAEGGSATKYPFGIRGVHCVGYTECKERCKATIRHNRRRFAQATGQRHESFVIYLAGVYCPGTGRKNAQREHQNWIHNVKFYLTKEGYRNANIE